MSNISSITQVILADSRNTAISITLPSTSGLLGRVLYYKDYFGTADVSSINFITTSPDLFENSNNSYSIREKFGFLQVMAMSTTFWGIIDGTSQNYIEAQNATYASTLTLFNAANIPYATSLGTEQNPRPLGALSLVAPVLVSSLLSTVSTFIDFGNLNAIPRATAAGGAFRFLMGVERGSVANNGYMFKIKRWNSYGNPRITYGANFSTLRDSFVVDNQSQIGINTSLPTALLDVNGTIRTPYFSTSWLSTNRVQVNTSNNLTWNLNVSGVTNLSTLSNFVPQPTTSSIWVNVTSNANITLVSYNAGATWTTGGGFSLGARNVAYNGNFWVMVGYDNNSNNRIKYSLDGLTWSNATGCNVFGIGGLGVSWGNNQWVALGRDTSVFANTIKFSLDGITWSNAETGGFADRGRYAMWNGSYWVSVGYNITTPTSTILYSTDGRNWRTALSGGFTTEGMELAWNGRLWVAAGSNSAAGNTLKHSYDGLNWFDSHGATFDAAYSVAWNGSMFVATGQVSGTNIKYSYDGITWQPINTGGFSVRGCNVRWTGDRWFANGSDATLTNNIQYSFDGLNWIGTAPNAAYFNGVMSYSSNQVPMLSQSNLDILPQPIPLYQRSTNEIFFLQSTIIMNQTLYVNANTNRVGVNLGAPFFSLDVNGNAKTSSMTIGAGTALTSTNQTFTLAVWGAGGAGRVGGTTWTQISDSNIKADIIDADLDRCYKDIENIPLRRFTYTPEFLSNYPMADHRVLGLLAQEVQQVIPKAAIENPLPPFGDMTWLNMDQVNMSFFGAVRKWMANNEAMESTIVSFQVLNSTMSSYVSTLETLLP